MNVPQAVTAVAGCSCGGLEWHHQDCTVWQLGPVDGPVAVADAKRRLREYGEELNRRLRAEGY